MRDPQARSTAASDPLRDYRAKREPAHTPEPFGDGPSASGRLFVVQKHAARNLHYDLRLELDGVLKSWAVPKDPSYDQSVKRAAFATEDHPVEYASFEGVIPAGNYGAGEVIVWDRGTWTALEDPHAGFEKGKLLFELHGHRLRGRWTLVKVNRGENEWLLIKERDALEGGGRDTFTHDSILTGRTLEDMRAGRSIGAELEAAATHAGAPVRAVDASSLKVMLAGTRRHAFDDDGWIFELKYDGYRLVAARDGEHVLLRSRNGRDLTSIFPEVAEAVSRLDCDRFILDGEVVVNDTRGLPDFQLLQGRAKVRRARDAERAAAQQPATLYAFDLVSTAGRDLRSLPLLQRKELLHTLLPSTGVIRFSEHVQGRGREFFRIAEQMGLEGIVGKRAASPYRQGRHDDWVKIRANQTDDFVVIGLKASTAAPGTFGSFHVAQWDSDRLVYRGSVGTGVTPAHIADMRARTTPSARPAGIDAGGRDDVWVEPTAVIEVRYLEVTRAGSLRHPVFLRIRDDKDPRDCTVRASDADDAATLDDAPSTGDAPLDDALLDDASLDDAIPDDAAADQAANPAAARHARREVRFTNLDKVLWPEDGYTKGDLVAYYRAIAPWMLKYLEDRPVVQTRFPDGIDGKSFFQKDAPDWAPEWLRKEVVYSDGSERDLRYFVADNVESLEYLANSASIPLHVWSSRFATLEYPDWFSLDLDPKDAPFEHVIEVALAVHELCEQIGLPNYVKTSGSSGLHVLVPTGRQCTHDQAKMLGQVIAREIVRRVPAIATIDRAVTRRQGRVYVDYLQNGRGKLLVAPFCVRPLPGAPVSMPLRWGEVKPGLSIGAFTIRNAVQRMKRLRGDPMVGVLDDTPDLVGALAALERLGG